MISSVSVSGHNKSYVVNPSNTNSLKKQVPFGHVGTQKNTSGYSKKRKAGIALGIGAALLAIGSVIVSRGRTAAKAVQKAKMLAEIPPELQTRFSKLKDLSNEDFVKKGYDELVDYMGLKGVAPKEILNSGADGINITGGYNPIKNTIEFSNGFFNKMKKHEQINMMAHELTHCKQFTNMLRTEGLSVENYVESSVTSMIKNAEKNPTNIFFNLGLNKAKEAGKTNEFLENVREQWTRDLTKKVNEAYKDVLNMPKFKADSPEGKKAFEHLKANREYEGLNFIGIGSDSYRNNPLEIEAYGYGEKMKEFFKKYTEAMNL